METLSSMKLVIGTKKVGDNYIKKSNCEIIVVVPPMARVRKILSGPLPTLVIPGLSVVILLTRFTSSRGLEEILRFITILPQVQYLPRTRLQPLWRDKLMPATCFYGKKISSLLFSNAGTIRLTPLAISICSLQWTIVSILNLQRLSPCPLALLPSPFCSRPCFGMDDIRASAAPVYDSDPRLTELV